MTQRNSPERKAMLAERAAEQRGRSVRFTRVPGKPRLSTRGERGESWRTKKHGGMRCFPSDIDHEKEKRRSQNQTRGFSLIWELLDRALSAPKRARGMA